MILAFLLALTHGGADGRPTYPIDPWTLRKHVQHADLLAFAVAGPTTKGTHAGCSSGGHRGCDSTTPLTIRKVVKGADPGRQILVGTRQAVI
jgi:hypothetical protein